MTHPAQRRFITNDPEEVERLDGFQKQMDYPETYPIAPHVLRGEVTGGSYYEHSPSVQNLNSLDVQVGVRPQPLTLQVTDKGDWRIVSVDGAPQVMDRQQSVDWMVENRTNIRTLHEWQGAVEAIRVEAGAEKAYGYPDVHLMLYTGRRDGADVAEVKMSVRDAVTTLPTQYDGKGNQVKAARKDFDLGLAKLVKDLVKVQQQVRDKMRMQEDLGAGAYRNLTQVRSESGQARARGQLAGIRAEYEQRYGEELPAGLHVRAQAHNPAGPATTRRRRGSVVDDLGDVIPRSAPPVRSEPTRRSSSSSGDGEEASRTFGQIQRRQRNAEQAAERDAGAARIYPGGWQGHQVGDRDYRQRGGYQGGGQNPNVPGNQNPRQGNAPRR